MASVGDRSHHGGGPISPRPAGSGSHGLRRCSVAAQERRRELGWGRRPGRTGASARQRRASGASGAHAGPAGEFPFPRARPAHHPHPDTCDHRQLPSAETGTSWKRTRTPASFPQSEPADGEADGQTARQGPGPGAGARPRRRRTRAPPAPLPASCRLTRPSPLPRLHAVRMGHACPRGASRPGGLLRPDGPCLSWPTCDAALLHPSRRHWALSPGSLPLAGLSPSQGRGRREAWGSNEEPHSQGSGA